MLDLLRCPIPVRLVVAACLILFSPAAVSADTGPGLDPNGLTVSCSGVTGPGLDPNGLTVSCNGVTGPGLDPNGH